MFSGKSAIRNLVFSIIAAGLLLSGHDAPAQADGHASYKNPAPSYLGWYVEGRIGGPITDEHDSTMVSPNVAGANGPVTTETDGGFGGALTIGKYFMPRWRAEFEWAHGSSDDLTTDFSKSPANPFFPAKLASNGEITADVFLINVHRSWNRTFFGRLRPYNGIGLGATRIDIDNVAPANSRFIVNDSDTVFTAVYHSGFDWELSDRAVLTLRLSTAWTDDAEYSAFDSSNAGGILTHKGDSGLVTSVSGGLRIKLQ